jgi:heme exporter protein A
MLDIIDLDFDYQEHPVLKKINLHLSVGDLLHLQGANGAGKTTLLKLISGLHCPTQGSIHFDGRSIYSDLAVYQRQLCFVGHKTGINPFLTIKENCFYDMHYSKSNIDLFELASIFKLERYLDSPSGLLSAGQRRQVGLLRLWMTKAKLWLLDEPLVALDDNALALVMSQIDNHRKQGGAVLLTSHQTLPISKSFYQEYCL